jgi:plasmid stability protein
MQAIINLELIFMPALTIKNIPDDLYNELKNIAEQHHRSINSEVIICLERTLFPKRVSPEDKLINIQALRSQIKPNIITAEDIKQAIDEGRP